MGCWFVKSILGNAMVHTYFGILAGSLNMKISIILIHHKMNSFYTHSMLQLNWTFSSVFDNRNWQCLVTFNTALPHKMLDVYINVIKTLFCRWNVIMFNVRLRDNSCMERCCCQNMLFEQLTIYRTFPVDLFQKVSIGPTWKDRYLFILSS